MSETMQGALARLVDTTDGLIREVEDPGTEALAALWMARQVLGRTADEGISEYRRGYEDGAAEATGFYKSGLTAALTSVAEQYPGDSTRFFVPSKTGGEWWTPAELAARIVGGAS